MSTICEDILDNYYHMYRQLDDSNRIHTLHDNYCIRYRSLDDNYYIYTGCFRISTKYQRWGFR